MGIAIRTGSPLGLHLAEGVWRQLGGQQLRPTDLAEVDAGFLPALLCIRDMTPDHSVRINFYLIFVIHDLLIFIYFSIYFSRNFSH